MISPFLCYSVSFAFVLLVYLLGWSDLYPPLKAPLLLFIAITLIGNIFFHWLSIKKKVARFHFLSSQQLPVVATSIFIYVLWLVEFIYEGGIPLWKIVFNLPYNYREFGVPSLHVFVVTFSSSFTIYLFHLYLSKRSKLSLALYFINLSAALLIYNRGMLFFNITASIFVYLLSLDRIPYKRIGLIALLLIPLLYGFGALGSLRVSREAHDPYNNDNFMATGKATQSFRKSWVPKEYFWTYIYISSPVANLQLNVDKNPDARSSPKSLYWTAVYEILPDFITKRIHTWRDTEPPKEFRIAYSFTVGTAYLRAYCYSGWGGMILMATFFIAFPWIFIKMVPVDSDFFITGWATLCTMYFFLFFDNSFRFTGLSFQLVYPLIFYWCLERKNMLRYFSSWRL